MKSLSDTGCSRTVIAKNVLDKYGVKYQKDTIGERLVAAGGGELSVNGVIILDGSFTNKHGVTKTRYMNCLVSDSLHDEVIVSWFDAENVGAVVISEDFAPPRCAAVTEELSEKAREEILQKWYQKFPCLSDVLPDEPMKGEPMIINLRKDISTKPRRWFTPVSVPLHFKEAGEKLIKDLEAKNVIRRVDKNTAPQFCARGFFVAKPGGVKNGLRLVVDHKEANKQIDRPIHPFVAGTQLLKSIPHNAVYFAKLDALWGYYQIELAEESKHITTFVCEWGTFEYNRAPMGLNCSGDAFCRRSDEALSGIKGVLKLVDDILVYGSSYDQLFQRVEEVLQRCVDHGITLSKKKIEIGTKVTFAGFDVSSEGISPTAERTDAIKNYPAPKNVTGVRGFQGLTQGLSSYAHNLAIMDAPIRELLKKGVAFNWGPDQQASMDLVKSTLTGPLVLKNFNPLLETQVITDASRVGVGFILRQRDLSGQWRLIQCGSRALNGPESRYAVCEIESLGILYALQKCRHYLVGMTEFEVLTDHKSLKGVFQKDLAAVENVRLRRCMERLQEYNFRVSHIAGKENVIADTLSRFPASPAPAGSGELDDAPCVCKAVQASEDKCFHEYVHSIRSRVDEPDPQLQELISTAENNQEYRQLLACLKEYKHFEDIPSDRPPGKDFWSSYQRAWGLLSIHPTGLIVYNNERIVVPEPARESVICQIHKSHPGINKSQWRFRRDYWWPQYAKDIDLHVKECKECLKFLPSQQRQPLINQNVATHPMEVIGLDLFQSAGHNHLVMVDQFSGFPLVQKLPSISTAAVIRAMAFYFNLFGNPRIVVQDNGTQLTSRDYNAFLEKRGATVIPSSAYFPQANGLAESAVKNVKKLLQQCGDNWEEFDNCLLEWRDTPNQCGYSPGEIFFARRMKTSLPILPGKTSLNSRVAEMAAKNRKELRSKEYQKRAARDMEELEIGSKVLVQDHAGRKHWIREATITGKTGPRGYNVKMKDGSESTRNRIHLKPAPPENVSSYVIPDGWIESELDSIVPPGEAAEFSNHEWPDSEEEELELPANSSAAPASAEDQPAAVRRSARSNKGKRACHSCPGCHLIVNYLNVVDNYRVTDEKLGPILRWAVEQAPQHNRQL